MLVLGDVEPDRSAERRTIGRLAVIVSTYYFFFFAFSSFSLYLATSLRRFASALSSRGVLFFAPGVRAIASAPVVEK